MTTEKEVMELAKKALDGRTKIMQMHFATCYMAGQLSGGMQAIWVKNLSKHEKREQAIDLFDHICTGTAKSFPEASEFIENLQKGCLSELRKDG